MILFCRENELKEYFEICIEELWVDLQVEIIGTQGRMPHILLFNTSKKFFKLEFTGNLADVMAARAITDLVVILDCLPKTSDDDFEDLLNFNGRLEQRLECYLVELVWICGALRCDVSGDFQTVIYADRSHRNLSLLVINWLLRWLWFISLGVNHIDFR